MPVETGRGRSRQYTGNQNLGQLVQWDCVGCGAKYETVLHPPEQGCPACGAGVPGAAGKPSAPVDSVARPLGTESAGPGAGTPAPVVPRPGTPARPTERPVPAAHKTVYRVIEYTGDPAWLEATLRRSLVGVMRMDPGTITATIVDDLSGRQQDLLTMAKRQPGVWLGQPQPPVPTRATRSVSPPSRGFLGALYDSDPHLVPTVERFTGPAGDSPRLRPKEIRPMAEPAAPPTGPSYTAQQMELALEIARLTGFAGCYTLAMALNQFAATVEDETMEREKFWSPQDCLAVANALLQLVPPEWQGEQEPDAAPPCDLDHAALREELQAKKLPGNCPGCGAILVAHVG